MNLRGIHHIAIIASDYERSRDFYVNKLGFTVIRENRRPDKNDVKLDLRVDDHTEIELFGMPSPPPRVTSPEACGLRHLAFHVDDIDAAVAELEARGIPCEPIRVDPYTGNRMTFFRDPDNLPLELQQAGRGSAPAPRTARLGRAELDCKG